MKKLLLSIALIVGISYLGFSQHRLGITVGPMIVDGKVGLGLSGHYRYVINQFRIGANLGYYNVKSTGIIPITAAFEYVFKARKVAPYLGTDLGLYSTSGGTYFGIAPTIGLNAPISKNIAFTANFKYHALFDVKDLIGINFGIIFKL